jgi:hypothetical protein
MGSDTTIRLPSELVENLRPRAEAVDFDGAESYTEYVLREVLHQLDDIGRSDTITKEEVRERLETLGYLE